MAIIDKTKRESKTTPDEILARVEQEEEAGLDISEHGMYGYPEQFIPPEEYPGPAHAPAGSAPAPATATAMTAQRPAET